MKLSTRICDAALAVLLACGLCLFGAPLAPLYADEVPEVAAPEGAAPAASGEEGAVPAPATDPAPAQDATDANAGTPDPASAAEPSAPASNTGDASKDEKAGGESSSSKDNSSSSEKDEEDKDDKEKDAEKEKADKEAAAKRAEEEFNKAKEEASAAQAQLGALPGLQAELSPCFGELSNSWARLLEVDAQRQPFNEEREGYLAEQAVLREEREAIIEARETASARKAKAVYGLMLVDEELAKTGGVDMLSVLLGTANATEAESYGYLLEKVATCIAGRVASADVDRLAGSGRVDEVNVRIAAVADKIAEVDERLVATDEEQKALISEVAGVIERGNAIAYSIERICSESRQGTQDAATKVLALSGVDTTPNTTSAKAAKAAEEAAQAAAGNAGDKEEKAVIPDNVGGFVEESKKWDVKDNALRVAAQNDAGAWYDAVDALAGANGFISYGMGMDFALDEDAFVEKWAAVINEFYAERGNPPLGGWGEEMARQAFAYHVDPRLCAAVSINESGGGAVCIRPHNAWGWGAADSDPYNLASEWGSWPIAIESWHRGMATNPYGLSSSPSVSKLSDIYCGTPIWAQRAVNSMERMYEIAKAQQQSQDKEAIAISAALAKLAKESGRSGGSNQDDKASQSEQPTESRLEL